MDQQELVANREKLRAFQREKWFTPGNRERRLHLGCGAIHLPDYVNVDIAGEPDLKCDIGHLPYADNSIDEMVSQHSLEHLPQRTIRKTLQHWFNILAPGGTLEVGVPDVELCMKVFLAANEADRWRRYIHTIFGWQISDQVANPTGDEPVEPGQFHLAGLTLRYLTETLREIGFNILESYHYDGHGTPSAFAFAQKPGKPVKAAPSVYEADVVMGTFTHRTTYLPALLESIRAHLPHIPMIVKINDGPINVNMELLRQDFLATKKRYWLFMDDDIQFLDGDIIRDVVAAMIRNKWAACGVYSTFDPEWIKGGYNVAGLAEREGTFAVGYFIMVDSTLVGDIQPDMDLPDGNTSVDTSYSVAIRQRGYKIGLVPHVVYHQQKPVWSDPAIVERTNEYLRQKWGDFYFEVATYDNVVLGWELTP